MKYTFSTSESGILVGCVNQVVDSMLSCEKVISLQVEWIDGCLELEMKKVRLEH
jgi:hypothetical protein